MFRQVLQAKAEKQIIKAGTKLVTRSHFGDEIADAIENTVKVGLGFTALCFFGTMLNIAYPPAKTPEEKLRDQLKADLKNATDENAHLREELDALKNKAKPQ